MQKQNVRVLLASENPHTRSFLGNVIEQESGVDIVGQAQDAAKALLLTKSLIPDVAVIDCYLPYATGVATIPLSRINGLDVAQAILEESPNTRVLLLSNLSGDALPDISQHPGNIAVLSRKEGGVAVPISLRVLSQDTVLPSNVVFADVELKQSLALPQQVTRISDKVIFFGAIVLAAGFFLTLTVFLAWPVGIPIALAGGATVLLGLAGKLATSFWRKIKSGNAVS